MSQLNGRKVTKLRIHQGTHVPGYGTVGTDTEPGIQKGGRLDYTICDVGVMVSFTVGQVVTEALVPFCNIIMAALAPEK